MEALIKRLLEKEKNMSDKHIEGNPWNSDAYKTITFESDVVDDKTFEHFKYLAYREELRELLISAYPPLAYNMAGGTDGATHLANVILAYGYHKQSKWISVEERLPEPNVGCIVAAKVGNRMVTDFAERVAYYNLRTQETTYAWEIMHDWDEGEGCEITHWMPLPEAPKMKGENDEQI
jgi:hypothetical protein